VGEGVLSIGLQEKFKGAGEGYHCRNCLRTYICEPLTKSGARVADGLAMGSISYRWTSLSRNIYDETVLGEFQRCRTVFDRRDRK